MLTSSITFALSADDQPVPGIDALQASVLFVLVRGRVRDWILKTWAAAGRHGVIVIADDDWANPGGVESLTIPAAEIDMDALAAVRRRLAKTGKGDDGG